MPRIATIHDVAAFFGVAVDVVEALRKRLRDERLVSTAEAAEIIGVGVDTLERWRAVGYGPAWYRFDARGQRTRGGAPARARTLPRYRRADLEAWIEAQRKEGSC